MKTYRVYAEYVQGVFIDVIAPCHETAQDIAIDLPVTEWTLVNKPIQLDITEVDYA